MALNSINTNVAAMRAQENIGKANTASGSSIARLSSGNRIVRAADDVASMSAGTSLRTNVTTLRTALINTSQGSSMLQVADGALNQVTDILLRQKAIAVQAGSGSLSSSERSFLNQEFQNLTQEIDRIADQTNFNGVNLLDGSLFDITSLDQEEAASASGTIALTMDTNIGAGGNEAYIFNGVTVTEGTNYTGSAVSSNATLQALAAFLNSSTNPNLAVADYSVSGNTLTVTTRGGGDLAENYTFDENGAGGVTVGGKLTANATIYVAQNASDTGISAGDVTATGTLGDNVIFTQDQEAATTTITFSSTSAFTATTATITFDDGDAGTVVLTEGTEWTIQTEADGTTTDVEATIDDMVGAINRYSTQANADDYVLNQVEARREGLNLVIEKRVAGDVYESDRTTTASTAVAVANITNTTALNAGMNNGEDTGVHLGGLTNNDFVGSVSGFQATFTASNTVDLSIAIGSRTYTASGVNVAQDNMTDLNNDLGAGAETFIADRTGAVRLQSAEGDYFDIDLVGGLRSIAVADQGEADTLAARLDAAIGGLTFYQEREVSTYTAAGDITVNGTTIGSLNGSSVSLRLADFTDAAIDSVSVTAAPDSASDATIVAVVNGVEYRSSDLSDEIGERGVVVLSSTANPENQLIFRNGDTAIELTSSDQAAAFQTALEKAFGFGEGGDTVSFQVGTTTADSLEIGIGTVTTEALYGGASIDVLTQASAGVAGDVLGDAIDAVTAVRAEVGALQSRFDFASANIESSLQNQDAARGVLLDTDIAAESTSFATAQVQLQAGISVLAQANLLSQNLLKLIG